MTCEPRERALLIRLEAGQIRQTFSAETAQRSGAPESQLKYQDWVEGPKSFL